MSEQARIVFTIRGNTLEISGPEEFVSAQVEVFRETILASWTSGADPSTADTETETEQPPPAPHQEPTNGNKYQRVLHIEDKTVNILKSIPGTTKSKKAVGTTLVYLWAKRQVGVDAVPYDELRELCKTHGCLDETNFAKTMKSAREFIVVDGVKGSPLQTCKLTVPGIEKAEAILKQLNGDESTKDSGTGE